MTGDRSCVVTGAASGIGLGIAELLLTLGWTVVGVDRQSEELEATAGRLGSCFLPLAGDVVERAVSERAAQLASASAPLRGWVNNAGIEILEPAHAVSDAAMRAQLEVNVVGTLWGCSVAVNAMRATGGGSVVNLSSIQALQPLPSTFVYAATKGAVSSLSKQLAIDYAAEGIRCNAVLPGAIRTPLNQRNFEATGDAATAEAKEAWLSPMGRLGETREVAEVVGWLLSDRSSFVTGQEIVVDGGATTRLTSSPRDLGGSRP